MGWYITDYVNEIYNPCLRLAKIRALLIQKFDLQEDGDGFDDIECICEQMLYWHKSGDYCDKIWMPQWKLFIVSTKV